MLMEAVVGRENMWRALKRVESNKGAAGVDAMPLSELRGYLREHWPRIKEELLEGRFQPAPVRNVQRQLFFPSNDNYNSRRISPVFHPLPRLIFVVSVK